MPTETAPVPSLPRETWEEIKPDEQVQKKHKNTPKTPKHKKPVAYSRILQDSSHPWEFATSWMCWAKFNFLLKFILRSSLQSLMVSSFNDNSNYFSSHSQMHPLNPIISSLCVISHSQQKGFGSHFSHFLIKKSEITPTHIYTQEYTPCSFFSGITFLCGYFLREGKGRVSLF